VRDRVLEVFGNEQQTGDLASKLKIVPPGMDPTLFKLSQDLEKSQQQFLSKVRQRLQENDKGRHYQKMPAFESKPESNLHHELVELGETYDQTPIKQIYRKNRFISEGEQANRLILPILIF
jgi:hypothetical protein